MKVYGMKRWKVFESFIQRDEKGNIRGMAGKIDSLCAVTIGSAVGEWGQLNICFSIGISE